MDSAKQVRVFLIGTALAIGAYGIGQVVVLVAALALVAIGLPVFESTALQIGLGTVMLQGVTFGGVALGYLYLSDRPLSFLEIRRPTLRDGLLAIAGVFLLFATLAAVTWVFATFGIEAAQNQIVEMGASNPIVFLWLVPLSYLLIGPGEELLYRGLIQGLFEEYFSGPRAIVLASALFAVVHVFSLAGTGKLAYVGIVFALAIILGVLYEYTENLLVPAFVHGTYNAVLFTITYLSAVDGTLPGA